MEKFVVITDGAGNCDPLMGDRTRRFDDKETATAFAIATAERGIRVGVYTLVNTVSPMVQIKEVEDEP